MQISDQTFITALAAVTNWTDFYERLGYSGRPGGNTQRQVKSKVMYLGLSTDHFFTRPGPKRKWASEDLLHALPIASSWNDLGDQLEGRPSIMRNEALSMGLVSEVERLDAVGHMTPPGHPPLESPVCLNRLQDAAIHMALSWYCLHGYETFIPVAQSDDDIDVRMGRELVKIQVKTSTHKPALHK